MNTYSHAQYFNIYRSDICVIALWIKRVAGNVFNIELFIGRSQKQDIEKRTTVGDRILFIYT